VKHILVWICLAFILGIIFAANLNLSYPVFYLISIICLFIAVIFLGEKLNLIILLSCFLFGVCIFKNHQNLPENHVSKILRAETQDIYAFRGIIDTQPFIDRGKTLFVLQVKSVIVDDLIYDCTGQIFARIKGKNNLSYGDEVFLEGSVQRPYFNGEGRRFNVYVKSASQCVKLNSNRGFFLKRLSFHLKEKLQSIINKNIPPLAAGVLKAILLGDKREVSRLIYASMIKTGTVHILVVSGFNVGLVAFAVGLLLKLIRLPRSLRPLIIILFLIIYCLMTGASTPVLRATVMSIFFILGFMLKREPDIYNSLSLAAVCILIVNPAQIFDIGFQLSFASVISLVSIYPRLKSLLRIELLKLRPLRFIANSCLVSFSAWLATFGFIAYYFRIFSPVTVFANIFIAPLAVLITLCGFSLIFVNFILPFLTPLFGLAVEAAVLLLVKLNFLFLNLPLACIKLG
jgi:competence protein ComEC